MASVRVRSDGRLFFDFRFRGIRCRELTTLEDTVANRRKMEKMLATIETEIGLGSFRYERFFPGSKKAAQFATPNVSTRALMAMPPHPPDIATGAAELPTFRQFTADWLVEKQIEWRHSHRANVESTLNGHLYPAFGELPLDHITRERVLAFRAELATRQVRMPNKKAAGGRTVSAATINKIMGILRMILDEAALRFGVRNPCAALKRLKVPRKDIEPFTLDEVQLIIERARTDYKPYFTVRFLTGVRSGEVHGLKWKHIDFERRQILIRETYQGGRTEYTKTDGSQREIQMSQPVADALRLMRPDGHDVDAQAFADQYVLRTRNGTPIDKTNFNDRVWKPLLRNLGLAYRRPYQMRHTCATLWLAAGEAPEWIARQLGHTTTEMLFRTYSRYVPNLMRRDGSAFDRMIVGSIHGGITNLDHDEGSA